MRRLFFVCLVSMAILCGSCSNNPVTTAAGTTYPISTRIDFSLVPNLSAGGLSIHAATENSYSHSDYILEYKLAQDTTSITLTITDAYEGPSGSVSVPAPAIADVYLGVLTAGTYTLNVTVNAVPQIMHLVVTGSSYAISNGTGAWTYVASPVINVIPSYTIWGTFSSGSSALTLIANTFLDSLHAIGATARTFTPGDYAYFRVDSTGTIVDENVTSIFHSAFALGYQGELSAVKNLVFEYGSSYKTDNITINVYAYDGEVFSSASAGSGGVTRPRSISSVVRK